MDSVRETPAGRRTLEVPAELARLLAMCAANKAADRHLFECQRPHELAHPKPPGRDWVIDQVHRICDLADVPRVTAHALRGLWRRSRPSAGWRVTSSPLRLGTRTNAPRCTPTRLPARRRRARGGAAEEC